MWVTEDRYTVYRSTGVHEVYKWKTALQVTDCLMIPCTGDLPGGPTPLIGQNGDQGSMEILGSFASNL